MDVGEGTVSLSPRDICLNILLQPGLGIPRIIDRRDADGQDAIDPCTAFCCGRTADGPPWPFPFASLIVLFSIPCQMYVVAILFHLSSVVVVQFSVKGLLRPPILRKGGFASFSEGCWPSNRRRLGVSTCRMEFFHLPGLGGFSAEMIRTPDKSAATAVIPAPGGAYTARKSRR
ncbi:hypothetical protein C8R46DRAFT_1053233 [Mycena filopes]|nr:hypothetical protein C8R46DRAFT_1053233 [Mycena filopes]